MVTKSSVNKIYHVCYEGGWEAEGFFKENGKPIWCWHNNDANWRSEYMDPLLEKLGFKIEHLWKSHGDQKLYEKCRKELILWTGGTEDDF